jgi:hypothetical protein
MLFAPNARERTNDNSCPGQEAIFLLFTEGQIRQFQTTDSLIIVTLTYSYSSPLSYILNSAYTLTESAFNRPRYVSCVPTYLNTGSVCP